MNTKTKHFTWSGLAYALVLILLASTMVGIVAYAAGSKTHNIGGNVSFSADGIEATIGVGSTSGGETTKQSGDVMQEIIFSTTQSIDTYDKNYSTWSDLEVTIDAPTDGSSTASATISFVVTNNSESDYLAVSLKSLDAGEATPTGSISVATSVGSVPTYIGYESGSNTATISITFTVEDADYDAKIEGFEIAFTLEKAENVQTVGSFTYALNSTESTATVVSYNGSETEVTVEDTVSVEEAAAESVAATANEQKIAAFTNNEEVQTISAQEATSYSITSINANAFSSSNCEGITKITLPETIEYIGLNAFTGCNALETIINKTNLSILTSDFSTYGIADGVTISSGYTVTINVNSSSSTWETAAGEDIYISINGENWVELTTFDEYDSESTYTTFVVSSVFTVNFAWNPSSSEVSSQASSGIGSYVRVIAFGTFVNLTEKDSAGMGAVTLDSDTTVGITEYITP